MTVRIPNGFIKRTDIASLSTTEMTYNAYCNVTEIYATDRRGDYAPTDYIGGQTSYSADVTFNNADDIGTFIHVTGNRSVLIELDCNGDFILYPLDAADTDIVINKYLT